MTSTTGISWTQRTWIPFVGCTHISPGCENCYAARDASTRLSRNVNYAGITGDDGRFTGEVRPLPDRLLEPLRWRKPQLVFVNSQSDLFHPGLDGDYLRQVLAVMVLAHRQIFQILTKRPKDMKRRLTNDAFLDDVDTARLALVSSETPGAVRLFDHTGGALCDWPRPNWWLGTSVENSDYLWRARVLREIPAAVRWLSLEPLLGPLPDLADYLTCGYCTHTRADHRHLTAGRYIADPRQLCMRCMCTGWTGIDWVVVGGESGPNARPMDPAWARQIRDLCLEQGVPFHFKQWGKWIPYEPTAQQPFWLGQDGKEIDAHWLPADLSEGRPTYGWWAPPWTDGLDDTRSPADPVIFRSSGGTAPAAPRPAALDGAVIQEYPPCPILDSVTP